MAEILFDEAAHVYTVGGRRLPSVTQVLGEVGLIESAWFTPESRERGRIVHLLTALDDLGDLDEESIDPRLSGYVQAWRRCKREAFGIAAKWVEFRVHSVIYGYCGTLDRVFTGRNSLVLVDLKTGGPQRWHALQTAAYVQAFLETASRAVPERRSVYLDEDGTYKIVPHTTKGDFEVFAAAARVAAWRRQ